MLMFVVILGYFIYGKMPKDMKINQAKKAVEETKKAPAIGIFQNPARD